MRFYENKLKNIKVLRNHYKKYTYFAAHLTVSIFFFLFVPRDPPLYIKEISNEEADQ